VDPEQSTEPLDLIVARRPTSELMQRVFAAMQEMPQGAERQAMSLLHSQLGEAGQTMSLIASIRSLMIRVNLDEFAAQSDAEYRAVSADLASARKEIEALRTERDMARQRANDLEGKQVRVFIGDTEVTTKTATVTEMSWATGYCKTCCLYYEAKHCPRCAVTA
jgi:hypothetical protein